MRLTPVFLFAVISNASLLARADVAGSAADVLESCTGLDFQNWDTCV